MAAVPGIWARLDQVGLTTVQACGDSARNVVCCPVAGVDADEAFDAYPAARAVSAFFTGNRAYANLPRKFKISVTGCRDDCAQAELNDIGLWPARTDEGTVGFNVVVGGGLSDGAKPRLDDPHLDIAPPASVGHRPRRRDRLARSRDHSRARSEAREHLDPVALDAAKAAAAIMGMNNLYYRSKHTSWPTQGSPATTTSPPAFGCR